MSPTKGFMELFLFAGSCPSSSFFPPLLVSLLLCFKGNINAYPHSESVHIIKMSYFS